MVIMAYVAINLSIVFTNVDTSSMGSLGHRFGWYVDLALYPFPYHNFLE